MTVITIDRFTGEMLKGVSEPVELRDEQGRLLGEFRPAARSPSTGSIHLSSEDARSVALRRMVERMRSASVSREAFPITREMLHERR